MLNGSITTYSASEMQQQQSSSNNSNHNNNNNNNNSPIDSDTDEGSSNFAAALTTAARPRSQSLRRASMSLNAVINHRRALLGALITGMGSNVSLPSSVHQQEQQDLLTGQLRGVEPIAMTASPGYELARHRHHHHHHHHHNNHLDTGAGSNEHKPIILQLTPVNTTAVPLCSLDVQKAEMPVEEEEHRKQRGDRQRSELMSTISTLYAKLLVVVGVAVPVTASVSDQVPVSLDRGFYLYLYLASVAFVVIMYTTLLRDKALKTMIAKHVKNENTYYFGGSKHQQQQQQQQQAVTSFQKLNNESFCKCASAQSAPEMLKNALNPRQSQQYGSFCLRLGTVGFGAGSLVFTGLQIGAEIASGPMRAIVPAARLLLVTAQMHFIFLNSKDLVFTRHEAFAKLGLMHLIATNVCEWLQALVEETKCEINQLEHADEGDEGILRKLLRDASPFLFPCTIEFSLICAVILVEMWRRIDERHNEPGTSSSTNSSPTARSMHHLSIDCGSAHRGLFGGVLVIAATVLSLIMFFVLRVSKPKMAIQQVTSLEIAIQMSGTVAAIGGALKLRALDYKKTKPPHLDSTLLAAAQAGVYLHCLFGAVGSILTQGPTWIICLAADFLALVQSTTQTILIKIAWRRRSRSNEKPGKELMTFLIVVNIAMWTVNTFEKSRAGVRPDHLEFFGVWAWTIITHVSMPLAIFYRFHSAICLFEVWKSCYKYRPPANVATNY